MSTKEIISPIYKVGIKILNDTQLLNVFPNYNDLISRIQMHRDWLGEHKIECLESYQYNLMYDNVISIFGKRGTGKTSAAFTLHKMLEDDAKHPYDVVLPIIIPEVIPTDGSVLGWLLAIVKDQVIQMEKRIRKIEEKTGYNKRAERFWSNCKPEQYRLSEEIDKLVELFHSAKYNPANELSYNIAVGNSVKQSQNYYEFAKEIVTFWDHWVLEIKELYKEEENKDKEIVPLIYFIFDDVDLAPQKVDELLSIIIKYLSHPNIIVITTADEEMFLEVIEERLDRDIGRLPKEWRTYLKSGAIRNSLYTLYNSDEGELVERTARRYLGKVMPASTRYYLKVFNTVEDKRLFHLDSDKSLWDGICNEIERLLIYSENRGNFLKDAHIDKDYYLNFLGNTSREIGNAYIGLKDLIDCLIKDIKLFNENESPEQQELDKYVKSIYNNVCRFLHISLNTNHELAEKIEDLEGFINEAFWLEHDNYLLYINYDYLDDYLRNSVSHYSKTECVKMAFQIYSLFHFTENIFVVLESCTKMKITGRTEIHGISHFRNFLCDQVFNGERKLARNVIVNDFFAHYNKLLNRIERLLEEDAEEQRVDREFLYEFTFQPEENVKDLIWQAFRKDSEWLQEISWMLSAVYGNLYLIGKKELKNCNLYEAWESLLRYQRVIRDLLEDNIYKTMDEFYLLEVAREKTKEINKFLIENNKEVKSFAELEKECIEEIKKENQEKSILNRSDTMEIELVSYLIKIINMKLEKFSFATIIQLMPKAERAEIRKYLTQEQNSEGALAVLKILYIWILEWDLKAHTTCIVDMDRLYSAIYEVSTDTEQQRMLKRLIDYMDQFIPEEYEGNPASWFFVNDIMYQEVKERLNRIRYACKKPGNLDKSEMNEIETQIERVERELDVAVSLKDKREIKEVIALCVRIQLAMRIQRFYIYYTVIEKYSSDYDYASRGMEYMRDEEKKTYYYGLFLAMVELVKKKDKQQDNEKRIIGNFISRTTSQRSKEYIRSILQEVNHE